MKLKGLSLSRQAFDFIFCRFGATICGLLTKPVCSGARRYLQLLTAARILFLPLVSPHHLKPQPQKQPSEPAPSFLHDSHRLRTMTCFSGLILSSSENAILPTTLTQKGRKTSSFSSGPPPEAYKLDQSQHALLTGGDQSAEPGWANQNPSLALLTPRPPMVSSISFGCRKKCTTGSCQTLLRLGFPGKAEAREAEQCSLWL